ncbi:MAG: aconitase X catalytic domain-containing protein [Methanobrevibacter sp.]|jgi:predicted aconitase|nr:aconitase X catalytic domain-containing protein [Candidatus Methanoflexus mossambicus]
MYLNKEEEKMYNGEYGETIQKSMEIIVALGDIYNASKLVDITSAQVSGVSYKTIGDAGLEYLESLSQDKVIQNKVPSTLNPAGIDLDNWKKYNFPEEFSKKQLEIIKSYENLGISSTCTCTPYLIGNIPKFKDHVAWSESSAVAYLNSVIGGRTNREGGPGALAAAITSKTALYGYHLDENRKATLIVEIEDKIAKLDYGTIGYIVGQIVKDGVPYFKLKNKSKNGELKSLGAALASSGAVALYHIEGETPEDKIAIDENITNNTTNNNIKNITNNIEKISISRKEINEQAKNLSTTDKVADLIVLGCPHSSLDEIQEIANFVNGKKLENQLWVCTSINVKSAADRMGYTKIIENSGGHIICDTCMVVAPIEAMGYEVIGVNSAKAANYVPNMNGLDVVYNNIENLIKFK